MDELRKHFGVCGIHLVETQVILLILQPSQRCKNHYWKLFTDIPGCASLSSVVAKSSIE